MIPRLLPRISLILWSLDHRYELVWHMAQLLSVLMQACQDAGVLDHRYVGLQLHWDLSVLEHRCLVLPVGFAPSMLGCRYAGTQVS